MMTILEEENNIIERYKSDIDRINTREEINNLYRQARVWNRFHFFFAQACTRERYEELNETFKAIRKEKLAILVDPSGGQTE